MLNFYYIPEQYFLRYLLTYISLSKLLMNRKLFNIKCNFVPGAVVHACNPKYSGGRDQENWGSKPGE
jgi:hypothetical protein